MSKKKKKKKNSRDKGNRGQRAVAKLLSTWWGAEFASTPLSGGFATKRFRDDWNAAADVVTPDDTFPFSVEVKWQEDWCLDTLLTSEVGKVWKWWEQCVDEAPEGRIPLLVFKRNNQPWLYMIDTLETKALTLGERNFGVQIPAELRKRVKNRCSAWVQIGKFETLMKTDKNTWIR